MLIQYITRSKTRSASHTTKIVRKVVQLQAEESHAPDWASQLEQIEAELEAMSHSGIIRPPWGIGLTDAEIRAVARHEELNCYRADWFDSLDSEVIREARRGSFRRGITHTLTELRAKRAQLKRELSWA
jgi:hypothetical protein